MAGAKRSPKGVWVALPLILTLGSCVVINSQTLSAIQPGSRKTVSAEDSGLGILHLTAPELELSQSLASQCRKGTVTGIEAVLTTRDFIVVQYYQARATGSCRANEASAGDE